MEISTKERLTGALLVVLALVVVVPELLSGHHVIAQGTPPAQNPEEGAPLQTYNMQLDAANAVPAAPRDVPAAAAAEIAAVPPPVTHDAPPPVSPPAALPVVPPVASSPVQAAPSADSQPSQGKPVGEGESAKPSTPTQVPSGKWWVQLGSFGSRDNAQHLAQKLRAAGFMIDVSQSRAKGKDLYRVRAGPVADKAAASALQARLAGAGEKNSSVVAP